MTKQVDMLLGIINVLEQNEEMTPNEAFDALLHFVGHEMKLETPVVTPWVKIETKEEVDRRLDLGLLIEDPWDWFGEVYDHLQLGSIGIENAIIPRDDAKRGVSSLGEMEPYARLLDDCCGTGRMILSMYNQGAKDSIYYGVELDLTAYRIALLNMMIYGIQAKILNCDSTKHDIREGSPNWIHSNIWIPYKHSRLLTEEDVNEYEAERHGR